MANISSDVSVGIPSISDEGYAWNMTEQISTLPQRLWVLIRYLELIFGFDVFVSKPLYNSGL